MELVYAGEAFPERITASVFLAGPTPRDSAVPSWRPAMIEELRQAGFSGVVFIPESRDGVRKADYNSQLEWELSAMKRSDRVIFWLDSNDSTMQALTSRVEFGLQYQSQKALFGAPAGAYKTRYMESLVNMADRDVYRTQHELATDVVRLLGAGAERQGAETCIPLFIWKARHFQEWYSSQKAAGHELVELRGVEWVLGVGPTRNQQGQCVDQYPLFFSLAVSMRVAGEQRIKGNESVIIRPSISSTCVFSRGNSRAKDRFLLVREYRTSVMNGVGFVYELPGGASLKPASDVIQTGIDELSEEAGLVLPRDRFEVVEKRQLAATTVGHQALLLSVELLPEEMDELAKRAGETHGNFQQESELTTLCVLTRQEIESQDYVDWSTLGMISRATERS